MTYDDPTAPAFDLALWDEDRERERVRLAEERRRRDAAWREDARTRRREKNGPPTAPSYVSVPVPDPAPGAPRSAMIRDERSDR